MPFGFISYNICKNGNYRYRERGLYRFFNTYSLSKRGVFANMLSFKLAIRLTEAVLIKKKITKQRKSLNMDSSQFKHILIGE